jgi:hypothetical protein
MSLKGPKVAPADRNLALLVKHEYFDEIISTNIDDALEEALWQNDMKATRDYEVIRTGQNIGRNALSNEKNHPFRITKPFGDFALEYIVRGRSSHIENPGLKSFLQNLLEKDLLIVGIDPVWDQDILRLISVNTKATIWFVNEDNDIVGKSPFLSDILRTRHTISILGPWGSYDRFVRKLYECLYGNVSPNDPSAHSQTLQNIQNQVDRVAGLVLDIEMQIKNLTGLLLGTDDKLQGLQNDHQAMFGEMQKIKNNLEEFEKRQIDC